LINLPLNCEVDCNELIAVSVLST